MKLRSALALFTVLGVVGWALLARAQDPGADDTTGTVTMADPFESGGILSTGSGTVDLSSGSITTSGLVNYTGGTNINVGTPALPKLGAAAAAVLSGITSTVGINLNNGAFAGTTVGNLNISPIESVIETTTASGTLKIGGGSVTLSGVNTLTVPGQTITGTLTLNPVGGILNSTGGTFTIGGTLTSPPNLSTIFSGGTTIVPGSHYPFIIIGSDPATANSYHASDLGDLSDWLAGESGLSASTIGAILNSGSQSKLIFSLSGFSSISPVSQDLADLSNLLDSSGGGWTLTQEYGVDNAGDIAVGATAVDGSSHALLLSPVPEPASVILVGCGLAALLIARRRFHYRSR
jgi:hypothetical protein